MSELEISWNAGAVILSVAMAFLGSYSAVSLTELYRVCRRVKTKFSSPSLVLVGNAFAVGGAAIWTMHFEGMSALSFRTPDGEIVAVRYNLGLTILSFVAPILCVYLAMFISTRDTVFILSKDEICKLIIKETNNMKVLRDNYVLLKLFLMKNIPPLMVSGVLTGTGVLVMHYIGMLAMECDAVIKWNYGVVFVSVVVAVVVSFVGYWILFRLLSLYPSNEKLRLACASVITVAVCAVHYIGMAGATYEYHPGKLAHHTHEGMTFSVSQESATTTAIVVAIVFNYIVSMSVQAELRSCYYRLLDFERLLHKTFDSQNYRNDAFMQKYKKLRRGYMRDMGEVAKRSSMFKFLDKSSSKVYIESEGNDLDSDVESRIGGSSIKVENSGCETSVNSFNRIGKPSDDSSQRSALVKPIGSNVDESPV